MGFAARSGRDGSGDCRDDGVCRRGGRSPGHVHGQVGFESVRIRVIAVQHFHQVADVGRGQPERFDFGQFGVGRHVGYAIPEVGEGVVDALRAPPFLFVCRGSALDDTHNRNGLHL